MLLAFSTLAANKDVPPAEAEDSDSSEEGEGEGEDDSDKEGKKEKESEDEKEDDKEDDEDDAFWPAEQVTVAVKYFPQLLQVLHRQAMTRWVTPSKTLSQLAATPDSLTDLLSEVVGEDDTNWEPPDSLTILGAAPGAPKRSFASQLRRTTKTGSRYYCWAGQSTARCIPQVC